MSRDDFIESQNPVEFEIPKGLSAERGTVAGERAVRISWRHWSPVCFFLMAWLAMWSFGCAGLAKGLAGKPFAWSDFLFATPFFVGEIAVSAIILFMIFGKTVVTATPRAIVKFTGVGALGRTKVFSVGSDTLLRKSSRVVSRPKGGSFRETTLELEDGDGEKRVLMGFRREERIDAAQKLLSPVVNCAPARDDPGDDEDGEPARDDEDVLRVPPKGLEITRDFEGKTRVVCRTVDKSLVFGLLAPTLFLPVLIAVLFSKGIDRPVETAVFACLGLVSAATCLAFLVAVFGRKEMILDHGTGETFFGLLFAGRRRRFRYGSGCSVAVERSGTVINGKDAEEIVIRRPGEKPVKLCMLWPNGVKRYLAAAIRSGI